MFTAGRAISIVKITRQTALVFRSSPALIQKHTAEVEQKDLPTLQHESQFRSNPIQASSP